MRTELLPYIYYDCIDVYWPEKPTMRKLIDRRDKLIRINRACPPHGRIFIVDYDGCRELHAH